ncbi:MAG: para-aminobenzoate synthetase/4-amino-4-deoxychorismate lyase [Verrucomicrobiales bacterium]|jgi:para-aminobenzoate synthetase/4-amino-4-deoxychorismate lyase
MVPGSTSLSTGVLRFGDERGWLRFDDPIETVTIWSLDEVLPALQKAEDATAAGHWVVGLLSYDAGPAFDAAVASQRDPDTPLLAYGIFAGADESPGPLDGVFEISEWTPDQSEEDYSKAIAKVREFIRSGETYQVNYTVRRHATFWGSAEGLFASLARAQRAKHDAFLHFGSHALCSASPEVFFTRVGNIVSSRPMKGTRPRHFDPELDAQIVADLTSSLKDRAENVMIVDMVRNDLGRIADVGSVNVSRLLEVEHYPTVHAMTSTVDATTTAGLVETLRALYPIASITGAPKYRTTEIIAELEQSARGAYCGSVFALAPDGRWEFNVVIRSVWLDLEAGSGTYGVGGGIVWDSEAGNEWEETEHKSRVLARAGKPLRLLETMAWTPDAGVSLRQRHINRLLDAGDHFNIEVDMEVVMDLLDTVRSDTPVKLRLLIDAAGIPELQLGPMPADDGETRVLPIDTEPTDPYDEFLVYKTTTRTRYEEAMERFPDAPDVILWNRRGELTETCIANLVLELDGDLVTPHHQSGLLPGTLREELLDRGQLVERFLTLDDLRRADRVFAINSVRGWDEVRIA